MKEVTINNIDEILYSGVDIYIGDTPIYQPNIRRTKAFLLEYMALGFIYKIKEK